MSWQVLHLRPRCEKKTAEFCRIRNFSSYLPLRSETKIYQRRKVTVDKPVFPGYLFASFDREGRLDLLKTNNIVRILTPPSEEILLRQIDQVRMALTVDPSLGACAALKTGTPVKITGGPFMGIEGVVQNMKGKTKVCLNVEMIGRAVAVVVDREYVEVVD